MWRTGGGEGGRAVFSLTRGGATHLRSVPEPSLADSIFSLEDAHVQDLGELGVSDCERRGVGGGYMLVLRAVCLRRSAQDSLQQTGEARDLLLHGLHSLPAHTEGQKSSPAQVSA